MGWDRGWGGLPGNSSYSPVWRARVNRQRWRQGVLAEGRAGARCSRERVLGRLCCRQARSCGGSGRDGQMGPVGLCHEGTGATVGFHSGRGATEACPPGYKESLGPLELRRLGV